VIGNAYRGGQSLGRNGEENGRKIAFLSGFNGNSKKTFDESG
jgi:hypothetical protein